MNKSRKKENITQKWHCLRLSVSNARSFKYGWQLLEEVWRPTPNVLGRTEKLGTKEEQKWKNWKWSWNVGTSSGQKGSKFFKTSKIATHWKNAQMSKGSYSSSDKTSTARYFGHKEFKEYWKGNARSWHNWSFFTILVS